LLFIQTGALQGEPMILIFGLIARISFKMGMRNKVSLERLK
jgi:hypothetical protein